MKTFIQTAVELRRGTTDLSQQDISAFDLVFKARQKLQSVFSKATMDINNVETLFGAFEMAGLLNKLENLSQEEITQLPDAMVRVIARTIERGVLLPVEQSGANDRPRIQPPLPYSEFAALVSNFSGNNGYDDTVSVITFNYDLALDFALNFQAAAMHLSEAENIIVIGYSLPETDEFFRYFYGLGSVGPTVLTKFWVVNPDSSVANRFQKILGTHAQSADCFEVLPETFEQAIPILRKHFKFKDRERGAYSY